MTFMGFVFNWSGLMAARWFLGMAEAGLFPGVNYYLSCWYKRSEFGIRAVSILKSCKWGVFSRILGYLLLRCCGFRLFWRSSRSCN
jgi:MFS family permease